MACRIRITSNTFFNVTRVVGDSFTLSDLQASGLPEICENEADFSFNNRVITEAGDFVLTEAGDNVQSESSI